MIPRWLISPYARSLVLAALGLACLSGCGKKKVDLYPTTGMVKINGEPAPKILVVFMPTDPTVNPEGPNPTGTTGEDGKFQLTTIAFNDGAPAGEYRVRLEMAPVAPLLSKGKKIPIPALYMDKEKSPLKATVLPKKDNPPLPAFEVPGT